VDPNDRRRVVRALELNAAGASLAPAADALWALEPRLPTMIAGLVVPRPVLHERIAARTEAMFAAGVAAEVRAVRATQRLSHTAARIHGLQDVCALLDGAISQEEATRRLTVRTRRYARRQETWMRRLPRISLVRSDRHPDAVADELARAP
jgi:tRNA dimethylallyltransferase